MLARRLIFGIAAIVVASAATGAQRAAPSGPAAVVRIVNSQAGADCHAVKFIGVRGSDDTSSSLGVIATAVSRDLEKHTRASGADYGAYGLRYTAVGIDWWKLTNIQLPEYRLSERHGRNMLRAYIKEQVRDCPSQELVVEGYSQGAHVVGDVFSRRVGGLSPAEAARVKAVVLIADPRFNSRESYTAGSFRKGRNGILGARSPGDLSSVSSRIRAWCRKDDIVCQGPGTTSNHAQSKYLAEYKSAIVDFIEQKLGWAQPPMAPPERYCGLADGHDVYVMRGRIECSEAREAIADSRKLPPDGNGPGSPPGWTCYRATGGPWGIHCDSTTVTGASRPTITGLGSLDGTPGNGTPTTAACPRNSQDLPFATGLAVFRVVRLNCSYVENLVFDWVANGKPGNGPVKFRCTKRSVAAGTFAADCSRGNTRFTFGTTG